MDIRTRFIDVDVGIDWIFEDGDLDIDDGLESAIVQSIFTDARASDDDKLPEGVTDRRGCWMDAYPIVEGDSEGSLLWLLMNAKQEVGALRRAEHFASDALAWLVKDKVAAAVTCTAFIARFEVMGMDIEIHHPDGETSRFRYEAMWKVQVQ